MKTSFYFIAMICGVGLTGCDRQISLASPTPIDEQALSTADAIVAMTIQAETDATAVWAGTFQAETTATDEPLPTIPLIAAEGTPLGSRTGDCPIPDGFVLQEREGFCISTPAEWIVQNVDGGLAGFLGTTPGQAIGLLPDWADGPEVCQIIIYVVPESSAVGHLEDRYREFVNRGNINSTTPISNQSLGTVVLLGFNWESTGGRAGSVFAVTLISNRLGHISFSGTACDTTRIIPILETLRFNVQ